MTEAEWLACEDPMLMLRYLIGTNEARIQAVEVFPDSRGGDRKLRLFACACYSRICHVLPHTVARDAVRIAERFADNAASESEFLAAEAKVLELCNAIEPRWRRSAGDERAALHPTHAALSLAGVVCWRQPQKAAWYASSNAYLEFPYLINSDVDVNSRERWEAEVVEKRGQCSLIRDIFGNPFRPVALNPSWLTSTVLAIANGIHNDKAFDRMPILADALQDTGCDNEEILNHFRGPVPHTRGCFVIDLLTGRQ
jgi:hypothetical protein